MKVTQKGFTTLAVFISLFILVLVGFIGLHTYKSNHSDGLVKTKLSVIQLSFWYPKNWHITASDVSINSGYFEIKSPDGFVLGFQQNKSSFFIGGNAAATKTIAAEVIKIDGVGSGVISADNGSGKFDSITVVKNTPKVGATFYPDDLQYLPHNPAISNRYVQINGGFDTQSFSSLKTFDSKESVKQAKQILQSLKFY